MTLWWNPGLGQGSPTCGIDQGECRGSELGVAAPAPLPVPGKWDQGVWCGCSPTLGHRYHKQWPFSTGNNTHSPSVSGSAQKWHLVLQGQPESWCWQLWSGRNRVTFAILVGWVGLFSEHHSSGSSSVLLFLSQALQIKAEMEDCVATLWQAPLCTNHGAVRIKTILNKSSKYAWTPPSHLFY